MNLKYTMQITQNEKNNFGDQLLGFKFEALDEHWTPLLEHIEHHMNHEGDHVDPVLFCEQRYQQWKNKLISVSGL